MSFPRMRPYPQQGTITIPNGQELTIPIGGSFIRVREADQKFRILLDNDIELIAELNDVFRLINGDKFKSFTIVNDSGFTLAFQLEIGDGAVETSKLSISGDVSIKNANAPNNYLGVDKKISTGLVSSPQEIVVNMAAPRIITAQNVNRVSVLLKNTSPAYPVWIGDVNVSAALGQGYPLNPNGEIKLETTANIYAHATGGANVAISVLEIEK